MFVTGIARLFRKNCPQGVQKRIETFSIRFFMGNRKPQFAVTRLPFYDAEISYFSKAFSSVQLSSFLFSQNIIQYRKTYRNCKFAREPRRNQKAYEAWDPQSQ